MMTTPLLMKLVDKWLSRQLNGPEEEDEKPLVDDDKPQVIVVGFGRFGQVIGRLLMANKMRITVLERDISAVNLMRKYGYKVYYGDATQVELLRSAGAEAAESIVITCNEPEDTMKLVEICRQHFPHLHILARARGRVEAHELLQAGVTQFSRETFSSALELGRKTLVSLGMHPHRSVRNCISVGWICVCYGAYSDAYRHGANFSCQRGQTRTGGDFPARDAARAAPVGWLG